MSLSLHSRDNLKVWSWLFSLSLLASPYSYEVDRGPSLELKAGALLTDSSDDLSALSGLRLSYSFASPLDAFLSLELDFTTRLFVDEVKQAGQKRGRRVYQGTLSLVAMEIYHPMAWRVAIGGGAERRFSEWAPTIDYRAGLGFYFHSDWGLWADLTNHHFLRPRARGDQGLEAGLSLQHIF